MKRVGLAVVLSVAIVVTAGCGSPHASSVPSLSPAASSPALSSPAPTAAAATTPVHLTGHGSADTSRIWAGYCAIGRRFSSVTATWVQPKVIARKGTTLRYVSIWVGLDGYLADTVEQIGTTAQSQEGINARLDNTFMHNYAWWEMYPAHSHYIRTPLVGGGTEDMIVAPLDTVTATVTRLSGDRFRLTLADRTEGERFSTVQESIVPSDTAEVIVEASSEGGFPKTASFQPVRFTRCAIDGRPIGDWQWVRLDSCADSMLIARPSKLGPDGASFTVWSLMKNEGTQ